MCMQSYLQKPWEKPPLNAELTPGSLHAARILVASKKARFLLKRFIGRTTDPANGLSDSEHADMMAGIGELNDALKPYLVREA